MSTPADNSPGYSDKLDADRQITMEERIAAMIFACEGRDDSSGLAELDEEDAANCGREILKMVLAEFRPDLLEACDPRVKKISLCVFVDADEAQATAEQLLGDWDAMLDAWEGAALTRGYQHVEDATVAEAAEHRQEPLARCTECGAQLGQIHNYNCGKKGGSGHVMEDDCQDDAEEDAEEDADGG